MKNLKNACHPQATLGKMFSWKKEETKLSTTQTTGRQKRYIHYCAATTLGTFRISSTLEVYISKPVSEAVTWSAELLVGCHYVEIDIVMNNESTYHTIFTLTFSPFCIQTYPFHFDKQKNLHILLNWPNSLTLTQWTCKILKTKRAIWCYLCPGMVENDHPCQGQVKMSALNPRFLSTLKKTNFFSIFLPIQKFDNVFSN